MAEIDTSIYNKLAPPDPLEALTKLAQFRSMNNQNLQFQQEYKARMAMGKVMQQAVTPDGQVDYTKAATLAAQDPDAAWLAPDLMSKAVTMQGAQLSNVLSQFDIVNKRNKLYGDAAASLLQYGDGVTRQQVAERISSLATSLTEAGVHDDSLYDGLINFMGSLPASGSEIHQLLQRVSSQSAGAVDSMDRLKGTFQTQDVGGKTHMFSFMPQTGQTKYIGALDKTPTPGERNALVQTVDPTTGQQISQPRQDVAPLYTGGGAPAGSGMAAPDQQGQGPGPGPMPQAADQQGQGGNAPLAGGGAPQAAVTGLGPMRSAQLASAAEHQKQLIEDNRTINDQMQNIEMMQHLAAKVHTGWGAEERMEAARIMKTLNFPQSAVDAVGNGDLAASQALAKYSIPNAMNTLRGAMGTQSRITNMEFGSFLKANPNLETDPKALSQILSFSHKLMRLKQLENKAYTNWINSGQNPTDFEPAWTDRLIKEKLIDPRYEGYGEQHD